MSVPPDSLLVRVATDAHHHVIERSLQAGTPTEGLVE
jgi:hypothetical protein